MLLRCVACVLTAALGVSSGCARYLVADEAAIRFESLSRAQRGVAAVPALRESDSTPVYIRGRFVTFEPASQSERPGYRTARAVSNRLTAGIIIIGTGSFLSGVGGFLLHEGQQHRFDIAFAYGIGAVSLGIAQGIIGIALTLVGSVGRHQEVAPGRRGLLYVGHHTPDPLRR